MGSERPRFLGESLAIGFTTSFLSSPSFDCRSPVTPSAIGTPRLSFSQSDSEEANTSDLPLEESICPIIASSVTFAPATESIPSTSYGHTKTGRIARHAKLKPESLHLSPLCCSGIEDHFLPRSAQSVTPSLINQPRHTLHKNELTTFSAINLILGKTIGVGVYSVPSAIFAEVGSVGMTIVIWVVGAVISFCGLSVYLDLGTALPRSGGERVYLERIFRRPRMLATSMFMAYVVLLGFSTPNCIILGNYAVAALGAQAGVWNVRGIAVVVISLSCLIHAQMPSTGLRIINVLAVGKMLILAGVILSGFASIGRVATTSRQSSIAEQNFSSIWAGTSSKPYNYATALLQVLYCFRGYNAANQVMSEVRNPISTITFAAPVALTLASLGYILANIAYFCAVEKDDFRSSGVVVASHFLRNIFGLLWGERILPCFIIISAFGNIAATSFAQARVNQELAAQGLLPLSNFWRKENWAGAPAPGLFLHWLVSVLVIILPPPGEIYTFLVNIGGYPVSFFSVAIAGGLLYLKASVREQWQSPCPAHRSHIVVFLVSNALLLIFPWIDPGQDNETNKRFEYYAYPATSLGILGCGAVYWVCWRVRQSRETSPVDTPLLQDWESDTAVSPYSSDEGEAGRKKACPAPEQKALVQDKLSDVFVVEAEVIAGEELQEDSRESSYPRDE
ncbi:uncharacterized protein Z519_11263 [Cladophialophora bantiana CBS 173.52]|uniref:High-affinity methionine permease n=1 Tax=Cladophialophora bantiana (strain ATCC 10958 / CBS 173.52 / CDC B-1940 / NIH 8579) TaxID=1442370 RepID=A0A0D2FN53_CLAB1|nr:uncharacterized protein Z519_11263 [Cladophialophora bantiana CBS 173.52]KIW88152.1 hypothetical protein Z519_11263 [Cladophialophora bantiana CBS 173.52]